MGYTSEVTIMMNRAAILLLCQEIEKLKKEKPDTAKQLTGMLYHSDGMDYNEKGDIVINVGSLKWYESSDDVMFFMEFIKNIASNSGDFLDKPDITFYRLGEEAGDEEIEYTESGPMMDSYIRREVVYNGDGLKQLDTVTFLAMLGLKIEEGV